VPSSSGPALFAGSARLPGRDLHVKLVWLAVFRTVATTLLLAVIGGRLLLRPSAEISDQETLGFSLIGAVYLLTLVYALLLRRGPVGPAHAYVQVAGDIFIASCLVLLTGGAESPFTFAYSLAVLEASILLHPPGALAAAAASWGAFAAVTWGFQTRLFESSAVVGPLPPERVGFVLVSNALAQLLVAVLAGYLSRQLRMTGGQLSAKEADLRELAAQQELILGQMPSGLITCEPGGRVTFINRAGRQILGLDERHLPGDVGALIPGVLSLGPVARRGELAVDTSRGKKILGLSVTPLGDREGSLLIVYQDLTDLRRVEDELKRVDHLAAMGRLSAQLAHEIRNPLASMRGSAQMLATDLAPDGANRRLAGILIRESDRLAHLVEDFLRFARPPPPERQACELDQLAAEVLEMLRADPLAAGSALEQALAPVRAEVDPDQLRQVLLNLLRNALLAVQPRGKVKVTVERQEGAAKIRIWDSGGSIPPGDLDRIFDPFFTTRPGGTGLGLSTAHSIIRAHGGMIQVTSSPAQGTEFVVTLP
jgi:two-component system sensor histidine kinase PilS (NtrC family)